MQPHLVRLDGVLSVGRVHGPQRIQGYQRAAQVALFEGGQEFQARIQWQSPARQDQCIRLSSNSSAIENALHYHQEGAS